MDFKKAVKLAMNGKEDGYSYLYQETYQKSYYVALKYMKNEDDALDVLQDAYIKAFQNLEQLEDAEKFPSWFSRIVASKALDELKRKKALLFSQVESEDFNVEEAFQDDRIDSQPELSLDKSETERLVKEMIDTLSDEQRICIMMYYVEEMSVKEMAETLGVSENTVKSRLNYGRKNIKEKVLELEKKGTKLYSLTPFPFFLYLLLSDAKNAQAAELPLASLMEGALTQGGAGAVGAAGTGVGAGAAGTGAAGGVGMSAAGASVGAGAAAGLGKVATGIAIKKVLIGIAAVVVVGGGTAGGVLAYNAYQENATEAARQNGQTDADANADAGNAEGSENADNTTADGNAASADSANNTGVSNPESDSENADNSVSDGDLDSTDTVSDGDVSTGDSETESTETPYTYTDLDKIMYATQTVNVRDLPSTDGEKLGSLTTAQEIHVTGQCNETDWYRIEYDGGVAYVSNSYLANEKPVIEEPTKYVGENGLTYTISKWGVKEYDAKPTSVDEVLSLTRLPVGQLIIAEDGSFYFYYIRTNNPGEEGVGFETFFEAEAYAQSLGYAKAYMDPGHTEERYDRYEVVFQPCRGVN